MSYRTKNHKLRPATPLLLRFEELEVRDVPNSGGAVVPADVVALFSDLGAQPRIITADVTGDGIPDYLGVGSPGGKGELKVIDGKTMDTLTEFFPYDPAFTGGLYVQAADMNRDGKADVIVTPDEGGGPVVSVYDGARLAAGTAGDAALLNRFFGIQDPNFRGGDRPAVGDLNGDGIPDLVISAGFGGGPRIAIFDGKEVAAGNDNPTKLVNDFFAFEPSLRTGVYVAAGDLYGDGGMDLVFGGGPGGGPRVRVFDAHKLLATGGFTTLDKIAATAEISDFFAGNPTSRSGVLVTVASTTGGTAVLDTQAGGGGGISEYTPASLLAASGNPTAAQVFDPAGGVFDTGPGQTTSTSGGGGQPSSVAVGGITLSNATVIQSDNGETAQGDAILPVVGTVHFAGTITDATHCSLSATLPRLAVGGFPLSNVTVADVNGVLTVGGQANTQVVGVVTLSGVLNPDGTFDLHATATPFSLLDGLVQVNTLALDLKPNAESLALTADATVLQVGHVHFEGTVRTDGTYSAKGTAAVTVAGFTIDQANFTLGSDELGASFSLPVPELGDGDVQFGGSYGPGGKWSLEGTYPGPVVVGPLTLTDLHLKITNDSLTGDTTVSIADLPELVGATVHAQIYYDGRFTASVGVDALNLDGFSLGNAFETISNDTPGRAFTLTIGGDVNVPEVATLHVQGTFNGKGDYDLAGTGDVGADGLTLAQGQFDLAKGQPDKADGFTLDATYSDGVYTAAVTGSVGPDGHVQFSGNLQAAPGGFDLGRVTVTGDLDPNAGAYSITVNGQANLLIATATVTGFASRTNQGWGPLNLTVTGTISGPLADYLTGGVTFGLSPSSATFSGKLGVVGLPAPLSVSGTVYADGNLAIGNTAENLGRLGAEVVDVLRGAVGNAAALVAQSLGALGNDIDKIANDLWNSAIPLFSNELAGALHAVDTNLSDIAGAVASAAKRTAAGVATDLWRSGFLVTGRDVAEALYHGLGDNDINQLAADLYNGIPGELSRNVVDALSYGVTDVQVSLKQVAGALVTGLHRTVDEAVADLGEVFGSGADTAIANALGVAVSEVDNVLGQGASAVNNFYQNGVNFLRNL